MTTSPVPHVKIFFFALQMLKTKVKKLSCQNETIDGILAKE